MATVDERELQINPIVATSVQHNTQVRFAALHTFRLPSQPAMLTSTISGHIQHS
jgi:hypothetical protein